MAKLQKSFTKLLTWILVFVAGLLAGCDYFSPQKNFTIAVHARDFTYGYAAKQLKDLLERGGYSTDIIFTESSMEAVNIVAKGQADLGLLSNHSIYIAEAMGDEAANLRTVLPLFRRSLFFYVRKEDPTQVIYPATSFANKTIGLEYLDGEPQIDLMAMLDRARVKRNYTFTTDSICDLFHFWGANMSPKHEQLFDAGWRRVSLDEHWVRFIDLNNPALRPMTFPGIPTTERPADIETLYSETLLITSESRGENAIHDLTRFIYQNKIHLLNADRMYASIDENHDRHVMLFPLHEGAESYLRRHDPSFIERYADVLALITTAIAFSYAGAQALKNTLERRKKDQVDKYFIEFLSIKESETRDTAEQIRQYNELLNRVLEKMTEEKLSKLDFHILSRLIQQELVIMKI